jgi:hypothetical protein
LPQIVVKKLQSTARRKIREQFSKKHQKNTELGIHNPIVHIILGMAGQMWWRHSSNVTTWIWSAGHTRWLKMGKPCLIEAGRGRM